MSGASIFLRGVEHHLHHALHVALGSRQRADVDAQAPGDRGADLFLVENLALDLACLENVLGQGLQDGFRPQLKAKALHTPDQSPLPMAHRGQRLGQSLLAPAECRPVCSLVDVRGHSPHLLR